jgi:hypothetical protein
MRPPPTSPAATRPQRRRATRMAATTTATSTGSPPPPPTQIHSGITPLLRLLAACGPDRATPAKQWSEPAGGRGGGWWRSAGPSGPRGAAAPSPMRWTPSAQRGKRWRKSTSLRLAARGSGAGAGAAGHPAQRLCGEGRRFQSAQGLIVGAPEELRAEGKSAHDVRRCLKWMVARQLFKLLERLDRPGVELRTPGSGFGVRSCRHLV